MWPSQRSPFPWRVCRYCAAVLTWTGGGAVLGAAGGTAAGLLTGGIGALLHFTWGPVLANVPALALCGAAAGALATGFLRLIDGRECFAEATSDISVFPATVREVGTYCFLGRIRVPDTRLGHRHSVNGRDQSRARSPSQPSSN